MANYKVPGYPNLYLNFWISDEEGKSASVVYVGTESDLLAAAITTADILVRRPQKGRRGPGRRDVDGDKIALSRWNSVRQNGEVVQRFKVHFLKKSLGNALKLPGVASAWDAYKHSVADDEAAEEQRKHAAPDPLRSPVARLTLLINHCIYDLKEIGISDECLHRFSVAAERIEHEFEAAQTGAERSRSQHLRLVVDNTR